MSGQGRRLVLVRHSLPEMITGVPASQWPLSTEGRRRCELLAGRLAAYDPTIIVSSKEPKATQTGQIVARALGLPFETAPGLHEHERGVVRSLSSQEAFQAQVTRFFQHPDELVLGYETADQAHARFAAAVAGILDQHHTGTVSSSSGQSLIIVSHGTVLTLFITRANRMDPVPFWKGLGLPAFAILSLPDLKLLDVVNKVHEIGGV